MDFLIQGLADLINALAKILPHWSFVHDIAQDIAVLAPYFQKANTLLPIDTVMQILALIVGCELMLISYYWISRVINLVRGAG